MKRLKENVLIFAIGIICLSISIFPYVVIRGTYRLETMGLRGRDAILAPLAAAMIIYASISFFVARTWEEKYFFTFAF